MTSKLKKPSKKLKGELDYRGLVSNDSEFMKSNTEFMGKIETQISLFTNAVQKIVEDHGRKVSVITTLEFKE